MTLQRVDFTRARVFGDLAGGLATGGGKWESQKIVLCFGEALTHYTLTSMLPATESEEASSTTRPLPCAVGA